MSGSLALYPTAGLRLSLATGVRLLAGVATMLGPETNRATTGKLTGKNAGRKDTVEGLARVDAEKGEAYASSLPREAP
jgi:hypothetical protein